MAIICPAPAPLSVTIRKDVNDTKTAAGLAYGTVGVGDLAGTDQPPESGSELA